MSVSTYYDYDTSVSPYGKSCFANTDMIGVASVSSVMLYFSEDWTSNAALGGSRSG